MPFAQSKLPLVSNLETKISVSPRLPALVRLTYTYTGIKVNCTYKITCDMNISVTVDGDILAIIVASAAHSFCPNKITTAVQFTEENISTPGTIVVCHAHAGIKINNVREITRDK